MNPRQFLYIGGVILLGLGIYGFIFPNPVDDQTVWSFSVHENYINLFAGVIAIGLGYFAGRGWRWFATLLYGLGGVGMAILGFAVSGRAFPNLAGGTHLELIDNLIYLGIGVYALAIAAFSYRVIMRRPAMVMEEEVTVEEPKMRKVA